MKSIGAFDAKTHLSRILEEVTRGEHFIITKHGNPIAELKPVQKEVEFDWQHSMKYFSDRRKKIKATAKELTDWKNEGRK